MSATDVVVTGVGRLRLLPPRRVWREASGRPWLLAFAISTLVVSLARFGPDWPAQEFRANLAQQVGLTAWNNQWYGGHPLPSYSLLYPAVAALFGARLTAVLAAVG
ncbi:MAG: putative integral rane protein, partial [Mycobacterium sp.]|nr:putative integral rane protein [Mycobacterium sp.]